MNKTFNVTLLTALRNIMRETKIRGYIWCFLFFQSELLFWSEFDGGDGEYEEENKGRLEKPPTSWGINICNGCYP